MKAGMSNPFSRSSTLRRSSFENLYLTLIGKKHCSPVLNSPILANLKQFAQYAVNWRPTKSLLEYCWSSWSRFRMVWSLTRVPIDRGNAVCMVRAVDVRSLRGVNLPVFLSYNNPYSSWATTSGDITRLLVPVPTILNRSSRISLKLQRADCNPPGARWQP